MQLQRIVFTVRKKTRFKCMGKYKLMGRFVDDNKLVISDISPFSVVSAKAFYQKEYELYGNGEKTIQEFIKSRPNSLVELKNWEVNILRKANDADVRLAVNAWAGYCESIGISPSSEMWDMEDGLEELQEKIQEAISFIDALTKEFVLAETMADVYGKDSEKIFEMVNKLTELKNTLMR